MGLSMFKMYMVGGTCFLFGFTISTLMTTTQNDLALLLLDKNTNAGIFSLVLDDPTTTDAGSSSTTTTQNNTRTDGDTTTTTSTRPTTSSPAEERILHELNVFTGGHDLSQSLTCPPPLVPYHNRIVHGSTTEQKRQIPKIIHVSMKSRCMPRDLLRTLQRWETQLPQHSIFFHDDQAVDHLFQQEWHEFPGLHQALKCILYRGAMTIDVWRVLVLWKYGGIYTDIDNWPEDDFTESLIPKNVSAFFFNDARLRPSQWFMAAEPKHPIMNETMVGIICNLFEMKRIRNPPVIKVTGPDALLFGYKQFLDDYFIENQRMESNGYQVGKHGKVVYKMLGDNISPTYLPRGITRRDMLPDYITIKKGYNDVVFSNSTLNVTRWERIVLESGVEHWPKHIFYARKMVGKYRNVGSCKNYLRKLESNDLEKKLGKAMDIAQ